MDVSISSLSNWTKTAALISQEAGKVLKHYWGRLSYVQEKAFTGDLVTEADRQSEETIIQALKQAFPTHSILAEESASSLNEGESDFLWVVDPLDGTTNYTHQYPLVAVSIGLLYKGTPILGVIYNPILEELFVGAKGMGASLNGQSICVSSTQLIQNSLLGTGFGYDRRQTTDNNYAEFCYLTHLSQGVRRGGSAALDLAFVATGRLDGYWERGLKPWDIVAGIVIVQEAGGIVSDYDLTEVKLKSGRLLATNGPLHSKISQELCYLKGRYAVYVPIERQHSIEDERD